MSNFRKIKIPIGNYEPEIDNNNKPKSYFFNNAKIIMNKIINNDKMRHLLDHYDIRKVSLFWEQYDYNIPIYRSAFDNNKNCLICKNQNRDTSPKYLMIYGFLKKKIGPDCARLITFQTLEKDYLLSKNNKQTKDEEKEQYQYICSLIFSNKLHPEFMELVNEYTSTYGIMPGASLSFGSLKILPYG